MDCVDCHNPHESTKYGDGVDVKTDCEGCHFDQDNYQKINDRKHAGCVDCHMPHHDERRCQHRTLQRRHAHASLRSTPNAKSQFRTDGSAASPYVAVEFACKGCHSELGRAPVLEDARLIGSRDRLRPRPGRQ